MRQIQKCASNTQNKETLQVVQNTTEMVPKQETLKCSSHTQTSRPLMLKSAVNRTCQIKTVSLLPGKRGLDVLSCSGNQCRVGGPLHGTVHPPSVLQTQGGRWLHYCCCCSALGLCCLPLMQRRIITIDLTNHSRKEWIWPWRSSTLMLESNTILSSSEVSYCQTFR